MLEVTASSETNFVKHGTAAVGELGETVMTDVNSAQRKSGEFFIENTARVL